MTTTQVFEYVAAPNDTVHLAVDALEGVAFPRVRTLCGRQTSGQWEFGDETVSGIAATCKSCRKAAGRPA